MQLPEWSCYYGTSNANALRFDTHGMSIWFSYKTPVAFSTIRGVKFVREYAGLPRTSAKHLNAIDSGDADAKKARIGKDLFIVMLRQAMDERS